MAPLGHKSSDSHDSASADGSPRELLSRESEHNLKHSYHHPQETPRFAQDLYLLKSDIVSWSVDIRVSVCTVLELLDYLSAACTFFSHSANSL